MQDTPLPPLLEDDPAIARMRGAWLTVDLGAIAHNVRALRAWLPADTHLMAVVKADGYGHGAMQVAQTALQAGADWLGVATVAEGLRLRSLGFRQPILLLGLMVPEAYEAAIAADLQLTFATVTELQGLEAAARRVGRVAHLHLKVDTGMTRVGCPLEEAPALVSQALRSAQIELAGVTTHLATAEDPDARDARGQLARFAELVASLGLPAAVWRHAANSAATLFYPEAHHDMVRPGLLLYGIPPRADALLPVELRRAMGVRARITQLREVPPGVGVGYGGRFVTGRATRLALMPVGYADGLPRALSGVQDVLVHGRRCRLVGNISMDQCVADVTGLDARVGDEVVLLGSQGDECIRVEEWADGAGTIPYEIVCGLGRRLPRVYLREETP